MLSESSPELPGLLVTGSKGLIGSQFCKQHGPEYRITNLDLSDNVSPTDITNSESVHRAFENSTATFVVHFAAFTNVTEAWKQTNDTTGSAYAINVGGTKNIVDACKRFGKHLIHISTAYVFDGNKPELYSELDATSPIEWYGKTKALAEELVQQSDIAWTILRLDQPFRSDPFTKMDVAHRIIASLQAGQLPPQFTNHFFGPTVIEDFSRVIDWVVRTNERGLFHAASGESWNDYDFATAIQSAHGLGGVINEGNLDEYLQKTNRPYQKNTALNASKLKSKLDFEFQSVREAIQKLTF